MRGRGRVNQKHPDFPKYVNEYKKLHNELIRKEDELLDPFFSTKTPPSNIVAKQIGRLHKQYGKDIRALQDSYSYLFEK